MKSQPWGKSLAKGRKQEGVSKGVLMGGQDMEIFHYFFVFDPGGIEGAVDVKCFEGLGKVRCSLKRRLPLPPTAAGLEAMFKTVKEEEQGFDMKNTAIAVTTVDYLHHDNIIYRDLKASNCLMNENSIVKVADFECDAEAKPAAKDATALSMWVVACRYGTSRPENVVTFFERDLLGKQVFVSHGKQSYRGLL